VATIQQVTQQQLAAAGQLPEGGKAMPMVLSEAADEPCSDDQAAAGPSNQEGGGADTGPGTPTSPHSGISNANSLGGAMPPAATQLGAGVGEATGVWGARRASVQSACCVLLVHVLDHLDQVGRSDLANALWAARKLGIGSGDQQEALVEALLGPGT
jgi:hypothetical protein